MGDLQIHHISSSSRADSDLYHQSRKTDQAALTRVGWQDQLYPLDFLFLSFEVSGRLWRANNSPGEQQRAQQTGHGHVKRVRMTKCISEHLYCTGSEAVGSILSASTGAQTSLPLTFLPSSLLSVAPAPPHMPCFLRSSCNPLAMLSTYPDSCKNSCITGLSKTGSYTK